MPNFIRFCLSSESSQHHIGFRCHLCPFVPWSNSVMSTSSIFTGSSLAFSSSPLSSLVVSCLFYSSPLASFISTSLDSVFRWTGNTVCSMSRSAVSEGQPPPPIRPQWHYTPTREETSFTSTTLMTTLASATPTPYIANPRPVSRSTA